MSPRNDVITLHKHLRDVQAADGGYVPQFAAPRKIKGGITETAKPASGPGPGIQAGTISAELVMRYKIPVALLDEFTYRGQQYRIVSMSPTKDGRESYRRIVLERKLPAGDVQTAQLIRSTYQENQYNEGSWTESAPINVPVVTYPASGEDRELVDAETRIETMRVFWMQTYAKLNPVRDEVAYLDDRYIIKAVQYWRGVARLVCIEKKS